MLRNKTQNKIIIYEIIIFIILIYISTWFIHNIVDIGSEGNSGNNGNNISSGDNNNNGNGQNNGNTGNNGNVGNNGSNGNNSNNGENENNNNNENINGNNYGSNINNGNGYGNNGNMNNNQQGNNNTGGIINPGIIVIPGNKPPYQSEIPGKDDEIVDSENRIIVKEDGITDWNNLKILSFFENNYYNNKLIAPGVEGTYIFTVENMLNKECVYDIKYLEENPYNINLQYRLLLNGEYIVGGPNSWVKCTDLSTVGTHLNANSVNKYKVDWKWEDADNDTEVGSNFNAYYRMKIKVDAIEIVQ